MDLGAAAFWIFLAAIIVAGIWRKKHSEAVRHETVRLLIEKNQKLEDAQLKELLNPTPPPTPEWLIPKHKPGEGYRVLRIFGTILIFIALGLTIACVWRGMILGIGHRSVMELATGIPMIMISIWMEEVRRKKIEATDLDDSIPVEDTHASPGERIDLDAALAQLPASMRLCIVLSYNEGMSHQEISDAANIPLGTVKANIARGAARLRLLLSDYRKHDRG